MKVLSLSLDKKIFDSQSSVAQRALVFGDKIEKYLVMVPGSEQKLVLSKQVSVWGIAGANKMQILWRIYRGASDLLKQEKFDLITVQDSSFLGFLGLKLAKKFALKFEVQIHGFEKFSGLREYLARQCLGQADLVRVVSHRLKALVSKKYSVSADKIYVAPVFVDLNKLANTHTIDLHKIYPDQFIFLSVGRLVPVKNIAWQLRAIKKLNNREKVKLVIVGEGCEKDSLKKLANDLNIREQVIFFGWQDKLGDLYHSADCLLLTSDSEGYGLVAVEAINCGLPVLMTEVGCATELIRDNFHGLVIPLGDEGVLPLAMEKMRQPEFNQKIKNNLSQISPIDNHETFNIVINKWQTLIKK